jgi:hypothetical protein
MSNLLYACGRSETRVPHNADQPYFLRCLGFSQSTWWPRDSSHDPELCRWSWSENLSECEFHVGAGLACYSSGSASPWFSSVEHDAIMIDSMAMSAPRPE